MDQHSPGHTQHELRWVTAPLLVGMSLAQSKDPSVVEPCAEHLFMPPHSTQPSQPGFPMAGLVAVAEDLMLAVAQLRLLVPAACPRHPCPGAGRGKWAERGRRRREIHPSPCIDGGSQMALLPAAPTTPPCLEGPAALKAAVHFSKSQPS